tara:strand:- start:1686 stop:2207 length:522 start_codon:yes stop_codon:yes gene_type:complete
MHIHLRARKEATCLARQVSQQICKVRGLNHLFTHYSILQQLTNANEWLLRLAVDDWKSINDIYTELPRLGFPVAFLAIRDGIVRALWDRLVELIALEAGKPVPVTMSQADEATRQALLPVVSQSEWLKMCKSTPYFDVKRRFMGQYVLEAFPIGTKASRESLPVHLQHTLPAR